jgi:aspartyl-tRNA(Asn)/glutamyl-tRNA(Gln) amidotransferase subunit B
VEQALGYEIKQQTLLWEKEEPPLQLSTRGWDADKGMTIEQREKESAHDYRYFPEPDIPPLKLKVKSEKLKVKSEKLKVDFDLDTIKSQMPELPQTKRQRFAEQYGFSAADAAILTRDYGLADYTEKVMSELNEWLGSDDVKMDFDGHRAAKLTANWLINNLAPMVNDNWHALKITPENLAEFISLIAAGRISSKAGQNVLKIMFDTGQDPTDVISTENLAQVDDEKDLVEIIKKVIAENPKVIADYRKGKENAVKFFIGAVMRETKGRAKPQKAEELLKKMLSK